MERPEINDSRANFHDWNGVLTHRINENNTLRLSHNSSHDFFRYAREFGYEWDTRTTSIEWQRILNANLSSTTSATIGNYESNLFEPEGPGAFNFKSGQEYYQFKQNFFLNIRDQHAIHFGAEAVRYNSKPDEISPRGALSAINNRAVRRERGNELALYFNDEIELSTRLALSIGLRYSYFESTGPDTVFTYQEGRPLLEENITDTLFFGRGEQIQSYGGFEPRLSLRYRLGKNNSLKLSYNRMRQYIHLISNTTASTPVDVWQLSNRYIPPQISDNFSLGYFHNFSDKTIETSIETFYRSIDNLVDYKDFAELLLNPHLETELLVGKGRAYGVELLFKRNFGRLTGWASYTFTRSLVKIAGSEIAPAVNNGDWYPANFDRPHDFTLAMNIKSGKYVVFGANFTYSTGIPITGLESSYEINRTIVPHFRERNAYRIPDYYRLDLSMTVNSKKLVERKYRGSFTIAIYNVLARENPFSVYYQQQANSFIPSATRLSVLGTIIPAVTYNFSF